MNNAQQAINKLIEETEKSVIGQSHVVQALVIGLLTNGHILLEGVPGLAKTLAINTQRKKSKINNQIIFFVDAPRTLRIPISFVRRAAARPDKPKSPRQAMTMARTDEIRTSFARRRSVRYWAPIASSTNEYEYS
jgi:hypothetical protein